MNHTKTCILVVDDEPRYVRSVRAILDASGYETIGATNGMTALELAARQRPMLILLDVIMPKMSGIEVCQQIRTFSTVPIIMLTALAQKSSVVKGLDAGADDYVTKPFSTEELLARVKSALRRSGCSERTEIEPVFQQGSLQVDYSRCEVSIKGLLVHLTPTEYRILYELTQAAGTVLSTRAILEKVWGKEYTGEDQLVARVVHRLRQKIELDSSKPTYIHTRPGIGYFFQAIETE